MIILIHLGGGNIAADDLTKHTHLHCSLLDHIPYQRSSLSHCIRQFVYILTTGHGAVRATAAATAGQLGNLTHHIAGLYAAGNAAGGIFFFNYAGGAQLGAATVYGRIAGRELANRAKQN